MKFTERFEAPKPFIGGVNLLPLPGKEGRKP
jgi:hypothetical protein